MFICLFGQSTDCQSYLDSHPHPIRSLGISTGAVKGRGAADALYAEETGTLGSYILGLFSERQALASEPVKVDLSGKINAAGITVNPKVGLLAWNLKVSLI